MLTQDILARYDARMRAAAGLGEFIRPAPIKRRVKPDLLNDALLLAAMGKIAKECAADGRFGAACMLRAGAKRIRTLTRALSELAQGIEARRVETPSAAPSRSDESPVGEADAPSPSIAEVEREKEGEC